MEEQEALLALRGVHAGYETAQVLFDISLRIAPGQAVSLLGRNGMGKTTLVRCIMGLIRPRRGDIHFDGARIDNLATDRRARLGLGLAPEGRQIFPNLSVEENLVAHARAPMRDTEIHWDLRAVFDLFPELAARRHAAGAVLSGGEQQMLAIGRALMTNPRLLILDEATEGLSPQLRTRIWEALTAIRDAGMAMLVIDKHVDDLMRLCDHHCMLVKGKIAWQGDTAALAAAQEERKRHLGI